LGKIHSLFENLVLQSFAAQSAFQFFDTPHGLLQLRRGNHGFMGSNHHKIAFQISLAPLEPLGCGQPMQPPNVRNGDSRLVGLLDDFKLLFRRPTPATLNACDHFHPG
jgi:hypothetical protein